MSVTDHKRIDALDVLRGFAVLGILVMNIQLFAMPMAAYVNPTAWGSLTGTDGLVWYLGHLLTDQKMMTLFSLLFGAGILVFTDRAAKKTASSAALHYRRNAWLLLFGALHAYLLWHGDILFLYAVCAFAVYPLRKLSPATLLALGTVFLAISALIFVFVGLALPTMPDDVINEINAEWAPPPEILAIEIAAYQGSWLEQMQHRLPTALSMQTFMLAIWGFWRAAGLMLMGMALYRLGVITGQASSQLYWQLIIVGLLVGLPLVAWGIHWNFNNNWALSSQFIGWQFNYWASLPVAFAWMAGIILLLRHGVCRPLTRRLGAVGRMAFSNYIMHSILCGLIFYGHGLGLFGEVSRSGHFLIVLAIWALQLWWSPLWLRHFRFGPLEWLWRALTYRSRPAMRRS